MSGSNLHKSDEGWRRLRERTDSGARAHRAFMDHRVSRPVPKAVEPSEDDGTAAPDRDFIVRKGRKRVRAFVAHNGRTE